MHTHSLFLSHVFTFTNDLHRLKTPLKNTNMASSFIFYFYHYRTHENFVFSNLISELKGSVTTFDFVKPFLININCISKRLT